MAAISSKLTEVEMLLIYQAKGYFEWRREGGGYLDWTRILETAGVTVITPQEAEAWVTENYVTGGFRGTDGLLAWLRRGLILRNGYLARHVLSNQPYRPIDKNDIDLNKFAVERETHPDPTKMYASPDGKIQCEGGLTGLKNPRDSNFQLFERWNAARYLFMLLKNVDTRERGVFYDDDRLRAFLLKYHVEYDGSLNQLRLDVQAFWSEMNGGVALRPHDEDQNCAIFIFHRLVRMLEDGVGLVACRATLGFGFVTGDENDEILEEDTVLRTLVNIAMYRNELSRRRKASEWCEWFVAQLFVNPDGCEFFNTNAATLTRVQFEVLRSGRNGNWYGNWKLGGLWELVKKGWVSRMERVRYDMIF